MLNLMRRETRLFKKKHQTTETYFILTLFHFLRECVPVCSHWSHCSFLAFVQKGNHSVGAYMPGPGLDLIECKLKKILLKEKTAHKYVYKKGKKNFDNTMPGASKCLPA